MKIRLAINVVSIQPGGAQTVLMGLLGGWKSHCEDLDITVFASDPGTVDAVKTVDWIRCIEPKNCGTGVVRPYIWQNYDLGREVKRLNADLVLTNNHYLFNIPCKQIVHHHNAWRFVSRVDIPHRPFTLGNVVRDWAARKALRSADRNVFVSDFLRNVAERAVPESAPRNLTIRNALDDHVVEAAQTIPHEQAPTPNLLVVQSANIHKDNPTVLRTMAELIRRAPHINWHVKIAGSDGRSNKAQLRELANDLGISDRVTWLGFCSHAELDRHFKESLCLISTSVLEAGPLPVIESMARGCPPVAARIPSVEEFVGDAGILVNPHRADQFAEEIINLYNRPDLRKVLVDRGVIRAQDFTWSNRAAAFCHLFHEMVGR